MVGQARTERRTTLPGEIQNVQELDELLSRPSAGLAECMKRLDGDIMVLGAGGKVGPSLTRTAARAIETAGVKKKVYAVDVTPIAPAHELVTALQCDLRDLEAVARLPKAENVVFMVGRKFGSTGEEWLTWAINVLVPYHVARAFTGSRIAVFSTGCVYPLVHVSTGGCTEVVKPDPVGEYAQSCLGRERMFDLYSHEAGERVAHLRLNYAVELRYGVLYDIAGKVWAGESVDVTTGFVNVIWQGDVCNQALRSLELASSPPDVLNIAGPEILSVRDLALRFGTLMGKPVTFTGEENGIGYLSNAARAAALYGAPTISVDQIVEWTASWIMRGGESLGKPTHFETQDGNY